MTAPAASGTTASAPLTVLEQAVAITAGDPEGRLPVLRTAIALEQDAARIASAELLATAHGVYEASIDGAHGVLLSIAGGLLQATSGTALLDGHRVDQAYVERYTGIALPAFLLLASLGLGLA